MGHLGGALGELLSRGRGARLDAWLAIRQIRISLVAFSVFGWWDPQPSVSAG